MLENQSKKILLLSNDPADASFLAEIAVMQHAQLEIALHAADLCSKIASARKDDGLAAIFVDVTSVNSLHKFEYEFQSKLGTTLAAELSTMTHFISGTPLAVNREVLQSPYFSFYIERKNFDFVTSAQRYHQAFYRAAEYLPEFTMSFDQSTRNQCFDRIQKEFLTKDMSTEWMMRFKSVMEDLFEQLLPARFEFSISHEKGVFRIVLQSAKAMNQEYFDVARLLELGVSSIFSPKVLVLLIPVFQELNSAANAFRFYKVEK